LYDLEPTNGYDLSYTNFSSDSLLIVLDGYLDFTFSYLSDTSLAGLNTNTAQPSYLYSSNTTLEVVNAN
jgi:hypothetical protein